MLTSDKLVKSQLDHKQAGPHVRLFYCHLSGQISPLHQFFPILDLPDSTVIKQIEVKTRWEGKSSLQ